MPDQTQQNDEVLSVDEIEALPVGSVVRDSDGDLYTRVTKGDILNEDWKQNDKPSASWNAKDISIYSPIVLLSVPDPYQEARLALRDVLGMEPEEQTIRNTMDTASRASTSMTLAAKVNVSAAKLAQAPLVDIVAERPRLDLAAGFGIALSGGGFAASATVDTDDTVNGLARLRAHSALDALLDQHGISR